jgi:virulence factor Mce-like protein
MIGWGSAHRLLAVGSGFMLMVTGCAFQGVNSLPLPGAVGRGSGSAVYHVVIANVGTLESNSPVMINDVVVGSVGSIRAEDWHADVEISVKPDTAIPANAIASVGQTSLLGSMHLALNPPPGQPPTGRLRIGDTIPLNRSSTYPSTEQTLSSLSAVVNGGGLGQIGEIVHNFNAALSGREGQVRDLLTRLDTFVGTLDDQHANIIASINELNRLSATFAAQSEVITRVLHEFPAALDVLIRERPRFTTALEKLHTFSDTATGLVNATQSDLVKNLENLEPTLRVLADVGEGLGDALAYATTFPLNQDIIDRGFRGDYANLFAVLDISVPRLRRSLLLGTRWGQPGRPLVPAPGDPLYLNYSYDPLGAPVQQSAPAIAPPADAAPPAEGAPATGEAPPAELPPPPPGQPGPQDALPPMDQGGS